LGGSDPFISVFSRPKSSWGRSRPSRTKRDRVLSARPAGAVAQDKRRYLSVGGTLISSGAESASRWRTSLISEVQMAGLTDHRLTHHTLRRTELGLVNAGFLHRGGGAYSFLCALLNSRGEESFTPVLHEALHRALHGSAARKARQVKRIDAPKMVALREGWHDVRAGATPPFDARCVTVAVWSLRPHRNFVSAVCAVAYTELRICQTEGLTLCMKTKGEARCLY
jgi:hypothetical protein